MDGDYIIDFDPEKNAWLRDRRGVCFDDMIPLIAEKNWLDIVQHPNQEKYPGQMLLIAALGGECYVIPFEIDDEGKRVILRTVYPSRKARKHYLEGQEHD